VNIKSTVFTDATPCSLVDSLQCFWSTCYLQLQHKTSTSHDDVRGHYSMQYTHIWIQVYPYSEFHMEEASSLADICRYNGSLRAEGSRDWILVGGEIFFTCPDWPRGLASHPVSSLFAGIQQLGHDNGPPPLLVPRLKNE
jgi:hypothetical protein